MRDVLGLVVLFAACGGEVDGPKLHRNERPAFELDLPAGVTAKPVSDDPPDGKRQSFQTPDSAQYLFLEWGPAGGRDASARHELFRGAAEAPGSPARLVGTGALPGGQGRWLETDHDQGLVHTWIDIGDDIAECTAHGPASLRAACMSLRPTP